MSKGNTWFIGYSARLWVPVSFEGWGVMAVFVAGLYLVYQVYGVSDDVPFQISVHWPILVEMLVLILAFYRVSRGHVDKRYA